MSDPKVTYWAVTWTYPGKTRPFLSKVVLTEGYSTMNDIPKILATKQGLEAERVEIQALSRMTEHERLKI